MFIVLAIEVMQGYYVGDHLPSLPWFDDNTWQEDDAPERKDRWFLDQAQIAWIHLAAVAEFPCS